MFDLFFMFVKIAGTPLYTNLLYLGSFAWSVNVVTSGITFLKRCPRQHKGYFTRGCHDNTRDHPFSIGFKLSMTTTRIILFQKFSNINTRDHLFSKGFHDNTRNHLFAKGFHDNTMDHIFQKVSMTVLGGHLLFERFQWLNNNILGW